MADTLQTSAPSGAVAAPVDPAHLNDGAGDAPVDRVIPQEDGTPSSISDAAKAMRERAAKQAAEQPRNPDGTFAPVEGEPVPQADGEPVAAETTEAPAEEEAQPEETETVEPKVFVLKGEAQRGEPDIELDITGLPPEVVERLERNEKQGMRRKEYDAATQKLNRLQADLDAVETEIAVDSTGFVLNHVPPAKRVDLAQALLVEHLDELRPVIQAIWEDESQRLRLQKDINSGVQSRRTEVTTTVQAARAAAAVKTAVASLVPDTADEGLAADFYQTSIALLQGKLARGESFAPEQVRDLLADHRRRFFGAEGGQPTTPPARPKLAVKAPSKPAAPAGRSTATTVLSQDAVKQQMAQRAAALATAKQGAGAGAVQRPGPPANATIEEASRFLRANRR